VTRTIPLKGMDQQAIIACLSADQVPPLDWPRGSARSKGWKIIVDECLKVPESFRPSAELLYEAIAALSYDSSASASIPKAELDTGAEAQKPLSVACFKDDGRSAMTCATTSASSRARLLQCPGCGLREARAESIMHCGRCKCELVVARPSPRLRPDFLHL